MAPKTPTSAPSGITKPSSDGGFFSNAYKNNFVKLSQSFNKYVVSPLNAFGLGGFVFDIEDETEMNSDSVITDNYVEDNSARHDNIAVRPLEITLTRFVGELIHKDHDSDILDDIHKITQDISIVAGLLPKVTDTVRQAKQIFEGGKATDITSLSSIGTNMWALVKNLNPMATKQQKAYLYLKALQDERMLVGLQTPFGFYNNMAIVNLHASQDGATKFISKFSITLKQLRFAHTSLVKLTDKQSKELAKQQSTEKQEIAQGAKGKTTDASKEVSYFLRFLRWL